MNRSSYSVAVRLVGASLCLLSVSCGGRRSDVQALYEANAAALEQSVDMSGGEADTDRYLKFDATTVALGDVPVGQTREVTVRARNISDDVLVIVNAVTSCSCTKIEWSKKPVAAGEEVELNLSFTADTEGVFRKKVAVTHSGASRPVSFIVEGVVVPGE